MNAKKTLIIVLIVMVVATVLYFVLKPKNEGSIAKNATQCSNWKAKTAIQKGLQIDPSWPKEYNISDCKILEWMYHIKFESGRGANKYGQELFNDAVREAYNQTIN